jgi:DNA modification methylase
MPEFDYSLIEPISDTIIPVKRGSKIHYGFHGYFTTQPFNVVQDYITHFSRKGDLVFDPFCGSGVTAVESLRLGRKTFVSDLNPFAIFLTNAKCNIVNIIKLKTLYNKVIKESEDECNEIENLPDIEIDKLNIPYWYPKNILLPSNADVKYLHEIFTKTQLYQLSKIKHEINKLKDCSEKDILNIVFSATLSKANLCYDLPDDGRSINGGQFSIFSTLRYRIPKKPVNISAISAFKSRATRIFDSKLESNKFIKTGFENNYQAEICSATNLKEYLKDNSVDYIYTDPPYGGHITYLDLSTVYNAWLGFDVDDKIKLLEAIEGGEVKQSRAKYFDLLKESFSEMSRVLKHGRWCSLVFHHKEPSLWTNIVETAKDVGLEFKNTTVQHTKLPSWHKIDVPQSVMSCQIIINFIKKESATFHFADITIPLEKLILDVAEREIMKRHGATLEEIINSLVPELFIHNISDKAAQTKTDYIVKLLMDNFDFDKPTLTYRIKKENNKNLGSYIPMQEKIKIYLVSYLKRVKKATFDEIISAILPNLINGRTPSNQEILNELHSTANYKNNYWVYTEGSIQKSLHFAFEEEEKYETKNTDIPATTEHNQIIFRLVVLGKKYELLTKIGNQEQKDNTLKPLNNVENLKYNMLKSKQLSYVDQIDCLWFAKKGSYPLFAFEVEHSTTIDTAFERFISLLKANSDIGNSRRLILVISKKKKNDFNKKIKQSSYIGSPHYLNNKIRYIYEENLIESYNELLKETDFTKFEGLLVYPEIE